MVRYCKRHQRYYPNKDLLESEAMRMKFWRHVCPDCKTELKHLTKKKKMVHVDLVSIGYDVVCPYCEEGQLDLGVTGLEGPEECVITCGKCKKKFYNTGNIGD